ncbi:MAG: hypothetical protein BWZ10_02625 [candidate division BRC1 bacterium ADurb.BinA364]|nr:MAG: hypothetical protein BWZ10_02625 [candidate division BRC1 bacterium ADurb.BinA364]
MVVEELHQDRLPGLDAVFFPGVGIGFVEQIERVRGQDRRFVPGQLQQKRSARDGLEAIERIHQFEHVEYGDVVWIVLERQFELLAPLLLLAQPQEVEGIERPGAGVGGIDFQRAALEIGAFAETVLPRGDLAGDAPGVGSQRIDRLGALQRAGHRSRIVAQEADGGAQAEHALAGRIDAQRAIEDRLRFAEFSGVDGVLRRDRQRARMVRI